MCGIKRGNSLLLRNIDAENFFVVANIEAAVGIRWIAPDDIAAEAFAGWL